MHVKCDAGVMLPLPRPAMLRLRPGWHQAHDRSRARADGAQLYLQHDPKLYYYNTTTGESSWEAPVDEAFT